VVGILISTSAGYGAFQILADLDLAHVKTLEYAVIVVPVQINLGILFGTLVQYRVEKRIAKKQLLGRIVAENAPEPEPVAVTASDEKEALLEV
jgi:hypothetical protein